MYGIPIDLYEVVDCRTVIYLYVYYIASETPSSTRIHDTTMVLCQVFQQFIFFVLIISSSLSLLYKASKIKLGSPTLYHPQNGLE